MARRPFIQFPSPIKWSQQRISTMSINNEQYSLWSNKMRRDPAKTKKKNLIKYFPIYEIHLPPFVYHQMASHVPCSKHFYAILQALTWWQSHTIFFILLAFLFIINWILRTQLQLGSIYQLKFTLKVSKFSFKC